MNCEHKNTTIWEPHLAGARKCLDCDMVYNPNMTPCWFIEPPSVEEQLKSAQAEVKRLRLALEEIVNEPMSGYEPLSEEEGYASDIAREALKGRADET